MAAIASPIPASVYSNHQAKNYRLSQRMSYRSMGHSILSSHKSPAIKPSRNSVMRHSSDDSSDDEDLAPIKLSAEAQAILGEDNSKAEIGQENIPPHLDGNNDINGHFEQSRRRSWKSNRQSPTAEDGSPAPRIMRVSGSRPSPPKVLARDGSFMYKIHEKSTTKPSLPDSITPAPPLRRIRVSGSRSHTISPTSIPQSHSNSRDHKEEEIVHKVEDAEPGEDIGDDQGIAYPSTILRQRRGDEGGIHSTMRVRRIGTGTLLNGPIRRGMIRRYSEEDNEQAEERQRARDETPEVEQSRRATEPELEDFPDRGHISYGSPTYQKELEQRETELAASEIQQPAHRPVRSREQSPIQSNLLSTSLSRPRPTPASNASHLSSKSSGSSRKPIFKIPSLPPIEAVHDQENEPPPTFKRSKPSASLLEIHEDQRSASPVSKPQPKPQEASQTKESPRKPLAARSNNTPRRAPPAPPPKMSLIDAATSAGANQRSKKSVHYVLNGRTYRRLDVIGRGGSSRVFRIMAENYKIFALKRVNLEEADMAAIAGFKGEIDLLKKLENVDRVIRLFDYEVNEEKGVLSVMMELGESDFNKMLNEQLKGENARLDVTFTRHYWKEMLECVKAVHDHGIVHSDLKPANFLLVKGQLKLIDFGIAGAIQDNTVNVHRENQIGTPNYMSPESLVCHTPAIGQATGTKLLKLGRPSDVWSLGCILYQMTYGQPPFAHITKQFERIMSIPNPKVEIQFPGIGVGGAVVPFGLIKTLRRCLQRDQTLRPTIEELLSEADPFLNPVAISPDMLGRVIGNVVGYCRKREEKLKEEGKLQVQEGFSVLPKDEEMRGWPAAFYEKLREAGLEGTAW